MRYWYVSSFAFVALVLQVVLLAEARAEGELGITNTETLNSSQPSTPAAPAVQATLATSVEGSAEAADKAGLGTGTSTPEASAPAAVDSGTLADATLPEGADGENPFARFDILSLVTGKTSGTNGDGLDKTGATSGEPDYSRWRCLYQSLEELPEDQKLKASAIVSDSLPRLNEIDTKISGTVGELQALTYSDNADPEQLPRLGLDLQRLREELKATLAAVNMRLQKEAGLRLSEPAGRGCESMRIYPAGAIKSANCPQ